MRSTRLLTIATAIVLAVSCYSTLMAQYSARKATDEVVRADNAAAVLAEIMEAPDQGIPDALLKKAYGIAVIPDRKSVV